MRQEWQFAYFEAEKIVTPILRRGDFADVPDELKLLHCEDFRADGQLALHLKNLIRQLNEPAPPLGKRIGVPSLPPHFLSRTDRLTALRDLPRTLATLSLLVTAFVESTHLSVVPYLSKAEDASMGRIIGELLVLVLGLSLAAGQEAQDKPATPAEQYKTLLKEYHDARADIAKAKTDEERKKAIERRDRIPPRFLELAEKNPKDPIVVDALFDMVWFGMPGSDQALALLQRDHTRSDRLIQVRTQTAFGLPQDVTIMHQLSSFFNKEGETFLRTVLDNNPHRDLQAQACLALARFYLNRANRLALLKERPEMTAQYETWFGKEYLKQLHTLDPASVRREAEALLERAAEKYGDVKYPAGGTVGAQANNVLFSIRDLAVGRQAPDIEGEDQDGKHFKLSDYRGKVVLLYFWNDL